MKQTPQITQSATADPIIVLILDVDAILHVVEDPNVLVEELERAMKEIDLREEKTNRQFPK